MNPLQRIGRQLLCGLVFASCLTATAFAQENDIIGDWNCGLSIDDAATGSSVNARFETNYASDGSYVRTGQLQISLAAGQIKLTVAMDESGDWHVVDSKNLAETATKVSYASTSETPSPTEQMIVQQMQEGAIGELGNEVIAEITALTADALELTSTDGAELSCTKA